MTDDERKAQTPSFVAIGACGHMVAAVVDEPEFAAHTAKEVAKWINSGLRIEKRSVAEVRTAKWCDCKKNRAGKQQTLGLELQDAKH